MCINTFSFLDPKCCKKYLLHHDMHMLSQIANTIVYLKENDLKQYFMAKSGRGRKGWREKKREDG